MNAFKDYTGTISGRLTLTSFSRREKGRTFWNSRCTCGNTYLIRADCIGFVKSCGCRQAEGSPPIHGQAGKTATYNAWAAMRYRMRRDGLKVYEPWNDFETFYKEMGDGRLGEVLTRLDFDDGFTPDNAFWESRSEYCRRRNQWTRDKNGY